MFKEKPITFDINPDKTAVENAAGKDAQELKNLQSQYEEKARVLKELWEVRSGLNRADGILRTPESKATLDQFLDYQAQKQIEVNKWLSDHNLGAIEIDNPRFEGYVQEPRQLPKIERVE